MGPGFCWNCNRRLFSRGGRTGLGGERREMEGFARDLMRKKECHRGERGGFTIPEASNGRPRQSSYPVRYSGFARAIRARLCLASRSLSDVVLAFPEAVESDLEAFGRRSVYAARNVPAGSNTSIQRTRHKYQTIKSRGTTWLFLYGSYIMSRSGIPRDNSRPVTLHDI